MMDHIVLAAPDLAEAVARFWRLTGIQPVVGGRHSGLGTANCLVGLGGTAYLEIIGPDPEQPDPAQPRPFGIDELTEPCVTTWCVRPPDFDGAIARARAAGYDPGAPREMSRRRPDGTRLTWRLTPGVAGIVPFLIDWGTTAHPTSGALPEVPLRSIEAEHPTPDRVRQQLGALDLDLPVRPGDRPRLLVTLQTADGPITLGPGLERDGTPGG
jgi:hypothetical protein